MIFIDPADYMGRHQPATWKPRAATLLRGWLQQYAAHHDETRPDLTTTRRFSYGNR